MPSPASLLLAATLLPLASFLVLVFVGRRMGNPLAGWVGTVAVGGSFACTMLAMIFWFQGGRTAAGAEWGKDRAPINLPVKWIPVGTGDPASPVGTSGIGQDHPGWLDLGVYVDSLTIAMFAMITLVATLVHVFSLGYMRDDPRFARFFTYLGLFCFSMLGLVLGGTLLHLFVFWELVGLCSYLLIGFWYEKRSAANAAIKAFVVNRVGDFGFLVGFGILFYLLGNVTLPHVWLALGRAGEGGPVTLADGTTISAALLTVMGICLFFGAVGKSAQFPLHVWLPDAMEGPTPVSALIHAATMVAAGVYLVGRIFPVLTPGAKLFVAIIGVTTLTMAALIAVAQSDIKKILAYSTLSQLGYMILAMGVGSWVGGLFHLVTHAFFKALLFLGAGSVIHAAHHEQEVSQYGGLWRKIPWTAATFGVAVLAIAGTPLLSGYYSKDLILRDAGAFAAFATQLGPDAAGRSSAWWLFWLLPTVMAYVTAFYMTRCWTLTFAGRPRNQRLHDHARETPVMWVPLLGLAVLSVIAGKWLGVQELLVSATRESQRIVEAERAKAPFYRQNPVAAFATAWPAELPGHNKPADKSNLADPVDAPPDPVESSTDRTPAARGPAAAALERGDELVHRYVLWAFAVGIGLGLAMYLPGYRVADQLMKVPPLRWVHTWLYRRMYFDELYFATFVGVTMVLSRVSAAFDRFVIDGLVNGTAGAVRRLAFGAGAHDRYVVDGAVNGVGRLAHGLGAAVRNPSSGRVRVYVTILMAVVALGAAGAVIVVMSR